MEYMHEKRMNRDKGTLPCKKPFLFKAALNYYIAVQASKMTFSELFDDLKKYIDNPHRRWK